MWTYFPLVEQILGNSVVGIFQSEFEAKLFSENSKRFAAISCRRMQGLIFFNH